MLIQLRPLKEADAHVSIRWRRDPDIWTHTLAAGRAAPELDDELRWIRMVSADPTSLRLAIIVDGHYVGNSYFTNIADGAAEFHIFIGEKAWWGKGLAGLVTRQMLQKGWRELGLETVYLIVHPENHAALKMYRRLGFEETGLENGFIRMFLKRPVAGELAC